MMNFTNATESVKKLNPHVFGVSGQRNAQKNDSTGTLGAKKRLPAGRQMNKTEREFSLILEARKQRKEINSWQYEPIKLRLADRTTYTPDFLTWKRIKTYASCHDSLTFIEIKGFHRDDAMVKFKVAREQFPWAAFEMWSKDKTQGWKQIL